MIKNIRDVHEDAAMPEKNTRVDLLPSLPKHILMGHRLTRNLALCALMLLTVVSVRNNRLPDGQTVLSAVQSAAEGNWDTTLGKISFVSNLLPETVSVFFDTAPASALALPCTGEMVHSFTSDEPYLSYASADGKVYCMAGGEVMAVAHGMEEERILRLRQDDGLEALYYNLLDCLWQEGDRMEAGQTVGNLMPGNQAVIEVRKNGVALDPSSLFQSRNDPAL